MMRTCSIARALPVEAVPTDRTFSAFGAIIRRPELYGERRFYSEWFGGDGLSPVLHTNRVAALQLPAELQRLERHPHAAQGFIPLDVERYLVTVAPARPDMSPDVENMRSFVFTRDLSRTWRVGEGLQYGMVGVNTGLISTEVAPFGGVKESGIGREGSVYGIRDYIDAKTLCIEVEPA